MTLNITNGACFQAHFCAHSAEAAIPFSEAMMQGDATRDIFSPDFLSARAGTLGTTVKNYREKMEAVMTLSRTHTSFSLLHLWFGKDTFCQLNLLTLLAYFEQIGYGGSILLSLIDDESFSLLTADIPVTLGGYHALYEKILLQHRPVADTGVIDTHALSLYFDYLSSDGLLSRTVREHPEEDEMTLVCRLLRISADYGLSDVMAKELIRTVRKQN